MDFAQLRTWFLWSMIGSLSLTALIGAAVVIFPHWGPEEEILGSTLVFGLFSLVALMCAAAIEKGRLVSLMWSGMGAATVGMICWMVLIWRWRYIDDEFTLQLAGSLSIIGLSIAHAGVFCLRRFDNGGMEIVRRGTIAVSVALATELVLIFWFYDSLGWVYEDIAMRLMGVLGILGVLGTVVTPILWRVQVAQRAQSSDGISARIEVEITCPRCRKPQTLRAGAPAQCIACKLRITIEVEEPRCSCGYLLYQLEADRCPECGRPVQSDDRWPRAA